MRHTNNHLRGFTIVELLIVIVVIGILAAISIVAYNGVQQRARASAASSALNQASKKISLWQVDNPSTSPDCLTFVGLLSPGATCTSNAATISDINYQYTQGVNGAYCITGTNGNVSYKVTESTTPASGSCAGHGSGGVAAITNMLTNPGFENSTTGWGGSSITIASASDWFQSGAASVKLTNTSTADTGDIRLNGGGATSFPSGITAGGTYTMSAQLRMTAPLSGGHNRAPRVMFFYSLNGSAFTESFGPKANNTAGVQTVNYTFTVPSGATGVVLGLGGSSSVIGDSVYYDNVILTNGSTTYNYADGSSPNWAWNGAANNSTSTGPPL